MQIAPRASAADPLLINNIVSTTAFRDTAGRTQASSVVAGGTPVIVTLGQSLIASGAQGTFTPANTITATAGVHNFNIWDGAIYRGANPVLGASGSPGSISNSANLPIGDGLITAGKATRVIMVPISAGGAFASDWAPGGIYNARIAYTVARLAQRGLTPTFILWHQGEAESQTGGATITNYTANVKAVCDTFRNAGVTVPFFVALETMAAGVTNSSLRTAQAACVDGPRNIIQGADWDTVIAANRYDGTHLDATGNAAAAALDVTLLSAYL